MLQELFNVADLPGSSVRDLFAGENPFDQWASPLQDTHRTSGAKLVSMYTGADQNGWGATLGGMGVEMVLDPLNLVSGAGVMKRLMDAKRAMATNKGIRAANAVTELDNAREAGKYGFVNAKRFADDLMGGVEEAGSPLTAAAPSGPKLIGYDPSTVEGQQWVNHGTKSVWEGSDDYPRGKFDLRFVGTGESGQTFGAGTYVAQEPDVIGTYKKYGQETPAFTERVGPVGKVAIRAAKRRAATPEGQAWIAKNPYESLDDPYMAEAMLDATGGFPEWLERQREEPLGYLPLLQRTWDPNIPRGPFHIEATLPKQFEDNMVRGDLPLTEQPPKVREVFDRLRQELIDPARGRPLLTGDEMGTETIRESLEDAYRAGILQDPPHVADRMTGKQVTQKVGEYLKSQGISGNKFLDRVSRQKWMEEEGYKFEILADKVSRRELNSLGVSQSMADGIVADVMQQYSGSLRPKSAAEAVSHMREYADDIENTFEDPDYARVIRNVADLVESGKAKMDINDMRLEDLTSNYAIWDQDVLDKTRVRRINGENVPLAKMLKGGRPRPVEALLDLVQTTKAEGSPLMKELPIPSLMSRKEALALGMYNAVARGGYTVE
jgi:hypothetical protein